MCKGPEAAVGGEEQAWGQCFHSSLRGGEAGLRMHSVSLGGPASWQLIGSLCQEAAVVVNQHHCGKTGCLLNSLKGNSINNFHRYLPKLKSPQFLDLSPALSKTPSKFHSLKMGKMFYLK